MNNERPNVVPLFPDVADLSDSYERLKARDGDGTSGGVTDDWKSSVDRQLSRLHGDVRLLMGALAAGFLFLVGAGWIVYSGLSGQITEQRVATENAAGTASERNAVINGKLDVINERLPAQR